MRLHCIKSRVVEPVDGWNMDNIGFASKEFWDHQHQNPLEPKSVVLYDLYDLMLVRKLLLNSIIFDFDYTFLGSLLDDYVE